MIQMKEEEEATLEFISENNYSNYYVQSPSSVSHANYITNTTTETELLSRHNIHNPEFLLITMPNYYHHSPLHQSISPTKPLLSRDINLSRCSSSRTSTTSFIHEDDNNNNVLSPVDVVDRAKNANVVVHYSVGKDKNRSITATVKKLRKVDDEEDNNEEEEWCDYEENNDGGKPSYYWQYFSFSTYPSSCIWIALQLLWRLLLSVMLALLVFYIVTKPPPPHVSLQVTGVNQFEVTQGLDLTGVATTFLSCNISLALIIDNKSKVFGLHILSPMVNVYFDRVPFILSQGARQYVKSREWKEMEVYAGTNKKEMYGGGRTMEDMLNSGRGLPLLVTLTFTSYFRVVANLIHSSFHHHAQCLLILHNLHDNHHHSPAYNSTCLLTS